MANEKHGADINGNDVQGPPKEPRGPGCPRLAQAMLKARLKTDISQADMASRLGISRTLLALMEENKKMVPSRLFSVIIKSYSGAKNWGFAPRAESNSLSLEELTPLEQIIKQQG